MFFKGSRYEDVGSDTITVDGREIVYKKTRFIGDVEAIVGDAVRAGERIDHLAHRHFKDSERFWRICDANLAEWPPDLVSEPGRVIGIPRSKG